jgi:hypothetical protein
VLFAFDLWQMVAWNYHHMNEGGLVKLRRVSSIVEYPVDDARSGLVMLETDTCFVFDCLFRLGCVTCTRLIFG